MCLFVPPESFDPPPRVDSAVVRMVPRSAPANIDVKLLEKMVQVAFSQRRKLLRHTLGAWLTERNFAGPFDVQRRAEEVPVEEPIFSASIEKLDSHRRKSTLTHHCKNLTVRQLIKQQRANSQH